MDKLLLILSLGALIFALYWLQNKMLSRHTHIKSDINDLSISDTTSLGSKFGTDTDTGLGFDTVNETDSNIDRLIFQEEATNLTVDSLFTT